MRPEKNSPILWSTGSIDVLVTTQRKLECRGLWRVIGDGELGDQISMWNPCVPNMIPSLGVWTSFSALRGPGIWAQDWRKDAREEWIIDVIYDPAIGMQAAVHGGP